VQNKTTAQQAGDRAAEAAEARAAAEEDTTGQQSEERADEPEVVETEGAAEAEGDDDAQVDEAAAEVDEAVTERADEEATTAQQAAEPEDAAGNGPTATTAQQAAEPEDAAGNGPTAAEGAGIAADLSAARAEAESYLDDLRRLQADFDNYRKRTLREQTARAASASQALVARLLPVLDNFELAVSAAEQSRDFDRMLKGVEMVFGELREVLHGEGLVKIEAEGKPFDPERHEAVVAVEQEDTEPGTVVDIVRAGYELRGKVLRPAMVKVAK
jgi:molecular chaperone GrpE